MSVEIFDSILGTQRVMILDDRSRQGSTEVVLLDVALFQGALCRKQLLRLWLAYVKIVVGELRTQPHHLKGPNLPLALFFLFESRFGSLLPALGLTLLGPVISLGLTIIVELLFDGPVLVRQRVSAPSIASDLVISGSTTIGKSLWFKFLSG
jgi:hypothetical protein